MGGQSGKREWWGGADVCVAAVDTDKPVDWSPESYVPDVQLWVPEGSFIYIVDAARKSGLTLGDVSAALNGEQVRLSSLACAELLQGWSEVEDAVGQTPADGWAAAMRLVFQHCDENCELLIEGP